MNYCGYSFGEYHTELTRGSFDHPITLINCCDEGSYQGPIFDWNGRIQPGESTDYKMQGVTMIDFTIERFQLPAYETTPGTFCGNILYHPSAGVNGADYLFKFWADGSGINFRTINELHAPGGSTEHRSNYWYKNLYQQYFDTTLNKLIIWDGEKWVDSLGNTV